MDRRAAGCAFALLLLSGCGDDDEEITSHTLMRYAAMGASDAFGVGAEPRENGYVFLIDDWLLTRYEEVPFLNAGIPGATATEIRYLELPLVLDHKPGAVTLWTGINDIDRGRSEADFDDDLREMLETLSSETNARAYVANIPDITRLPKYQSYPDPDVTTARVAAFNYVIMSRASQYGAYVIDLASTPLATDPRYVASDGFHPNNEGHRLIADTFIARMASTLPAGQALPLLSYGTVGH